MVHKVLVIKKTIGLVFMSVKFLLKFYWFYWYPFSKIVK